MTTKTLGKSITRQPRARQKGSARVWRALQYLKKALRQVYGARFRGLYLYGSYARGDAHQNSDVDTVIALAGQVESFAEMDRLSETLSNICLRYDLLIATYPVPEAWLRDRQSSLFENIRREGVRV
jgi:predicted nucleotidyltransferase